MEIIYTSLLNIGVKDEEGNGKSCESHYLEKFRQNLISVAQKDDWKYAGQSAQFQGRYRENEISGGEFSINSICAFDSECYLYSAAAKSLSASVSGIIKKNYNDGNEQFIIHRHKDKIFALNYDGGDRIAASISSGNNITRDIAVYNVISNEFSHLTGGDSIDDNPYFSKSDDKIIFDSRGIGRDSNMNPVGFSESSICALTENRDIEEIASEPGFDLFAPKSDEEGNLYYIRKPYKKSSSSSNIFRNIFDIILLPFWLIYGIIKLLFFAANTAKKSSDKGRRTSQGNNPYVEEQKSERELYIQNELINIHEEERRNRNDKHPGFAPKKFELWKLSKDGTKSKLAHNVLDNDLTQKGFIYTNGRYVFLKDDITEKVLFKDKRILKIRQKITDITGYKPLDPFNN